MKLIEVQAEDGVNPHVKDAVVEVMKDAPAIHDTFVTKRNELVAKLEEVAGAPLMCAIGALFDIEERRQGALIALRHHVPAKLLVVLYQAGAVQDLDNAIRCIIGARFKYDPSGPNAMERLGKATAMWKAVEPITDAWRDAISDFVVAKDELGTKLNERIQQAEVDEAKREGKVN